MKFQWQWMAVLTLFPTLLLAEGVRLQFLSLEDQEVEGLFTIQDQEMSPQRIPSVFLSEPLMLPEGQPLVLYRRNENAQEGEPAWREVARSEVAEDVRNAVVLVQTRGDQITAAVIPLVDRKFPAGSYMLFNRTPRNILIGLHQEVVRIPSQNVRVMQPALQERKPMKVYFRTEGDNENKSLVTTTWFHNPGNREFVFLTPSKDGLEIRVRSVSFHPPSSTEL